MRLNLCGGIIGRGLQLFTVMQLVLLAGELGEKYGERHEYYNLRTPADAIRLLCSNCPGLKQELFEAHHNGIGYKVIQGGASMGYEELQLPFGSKPLMVVPVISGAGGSTGQILLGVGLVAASFLLPGAGLFGAGTGIAAFSGVSTAVGTGISAIGAGLVLSGTANLISPQPELPNASANRIRGEGTNVRGPGPDGVTRGGMGQQSYAFTGPANTVGTGATLPVIYGRVITGSHLVAANLEVTDQSDPLKLATQKPRIQTTRINGEKLTRQLKDCGGILSVRGVNRVRSSDRRQRVINRTLTNLESGRGFELSSDSDTIEYEGGKKEKDKRDRERLDVILRVEKGLFDFAGAPGTTKIDGFIQYEITFIISRGGGEPDLPVANAVITLQGLVNKSQKFNYGHRFELPKAKALDKNNLKLKFEVIDAGVHSNATLMIQSYGYDLF